MSDKKQRAPEQISDDDLDAVTGAGDPSAKHQASWIFGYAETKRIGDADAPSETEEPA